MGWGGWGGLAHPTNSLLINESHCYIERHVLLESRWNFEKNEQLRRRKRKRKRRRRRRRTEHFIRSEAQ